MPDLVSILIPAYRSEACIRETMLSAINQTWPNKEVIVVDDGSPDRTLEVARELESSSVKVVTQENTGACGARNHALRLAQGDYIQWLDADDLLHPEKIECQLRGAECGTTSLTLLTAAWGKFFFRTSKARFEADSLWRDLEPADWIRTRLEDNVWMNPAVWLVSRRLTELAGPWDERVTRSGDDDGEYVCRVVAKSDGVRFVPDAKAYYRIGTPGSLNWNMETRDDILEELLLSISLTVGHLLDLANTPRNRAAAVKHLQTFSEYFAGADPSYLQRLSSMAAELGGNLNDPSLGWKYWPLERLRGRIAARNAMRSWRAAKLVFRAKLDRALHRAGL